MKKVLITVSTLALGVIGWVGAQESSAIKSQASRLSTIDARLESVVTEYGSKIAIMKNKVQRIKGCAALGQIFDGVGCVNAVEENPHVANFGKTTEAGLPSCTANSMLKATGAFTFECEDVTKYIPVPECQRTTRTISATKGSLSGSCSVSLGAASVGSQRAASCSQGQNDIRAVFDCKDTANAADWVLGKPDPSIDKVRFDDCPAQNVSLAGRCIAAAPAINHSSSESITCSRGVQHTYATAECDDGTINLTGIISRNIYTGTWSFGAWSACDASTATQSRTAICSEENTCDPSTKPADQTQACTIACSGNITLAASGASCSATVGALAHGATKSVSCSDNSPLGTISGTVSCNMGTKTASAVSFAPTYTGTWTFGAWGACDASTATQSRTATCTGGTCNPATKPADQTQACTIACSGNVTLSASGASCSASVGALAHGATKAVSCSDSSPLGTVSGTVSCNMGTTTASAVSFAPTYTGTWTFGAWGACDASTATQSRAATCTGGTCNPATKPADQTQACTIACSGNITLAASGASCSAPVGALAHGATKAVSCSDSSPLGTVSGTVSCNMGTKTASSVRFASTYTGTWSYGAWGACDASTARQTRTAVCTGGSCNPATKPADQTQACTIGCSGNLTINSSGASCSVNVGSMADNSIKILSCTDDSPAGMVKASITCRRGTAIATKTTFTPTVSNCTTFGWYSLGGYCSGQIPRSMNHGTSHNTQCLYNFTQQIKGTVSCNNGSLSARVTQGPSRSCTGNVTLSAGGASCSVNGAGSSGSRRTVTCTDNSPAGTLRGTLTCNNGTKRVSGVTFTATQPSGCTVRHPMTWSDRRHNATVTCSAGGTGTSFLAEGAQKRVEARFCSGSPTCNGTATYTCRSGKVEIIGSRCRGGHAF